MNSIAKFFLLLSLFSPLAFGVDLNQDLLACDSVNQGHKLRCKISVGGLPVALSTPSQVRFDYEYIGCSDRFTRPNDFLTIKIAGSETSSAIFEYNSSGSVYAQGTSFSIANDSQDISRYRFPRDCGIRITHYVVVRPSDSFLAEATSKLNEIKDNTDSRVKRMLRYHSLQAKMSNHDRALACTIKKYQDDILYDDVVEEMKSSLKEISVTDLANYNCNSDAALDSCPQGNNSPACALGEIADIEKQWLDESKNYVDGLETILRENVDQNLVNALLELATSITIDLEDHINAREGSYALEGS